MLGNRYLNTSTIKPLVISKLQLSIHPKAFNSQLLIGVCLHGDNSAEQVLCLFQSSKHGFKGSTGILLNILLVSEREITQGECWKHRIKGLWQRKRLHREKKLNSTGQVLQEPGTGCLQSREGICGSEQ